jgi:hypothetical protein
MIRALLSATLAAAVSSLTFTAIAEVATAAEIKILSGSAIETTMAVLVPQFE